jgi:hypothetical protein
MLPVIFICFAFCFLLERLIPGWKLPEVPTWAIRVLAINFVQLGVVVLAGYSWEIWLSSVSVFQLSDAVGPVWGGIIAYFIASRFFVAAFSSDPSQSAAHRGHYFVLQTSA